MPASIATLEASLDGYAQRMVPRGHRPHSSDTVLPHLVDFFELDDFKA